MRRPRLRTLATRRRGRRFDWLRIAPHGFRRCINDRSGVWLQVLPIHGLEDVLHVSGDGDGAGQADVAAPMLQIEPVRPAAVALAESAVQTSRPVVGAKGRRCAGLVDAEHAAIVQMRGMLVPGLAQEGGPCGLAGVVADDALQHVRHCAPILHRVEIQFAVHVLGTAASGARMHGDELGDAGVLQAAVKAAVLRHAHARFVAAERPEQIGLSPIARAEGPADGVVVVF